MPKALILGLASLLLAGCASSADALRDVGPLNGDPSVAVALQSIQGSDVTVRVTATNFKAVPVDKATAAHVSKEGHFHLFLDTPPTAPGEVVPKTSGIYHTADTVFTIHNMRNGHHTLWAELGYSDHTPYQHLSVAEAKVRGALAKIEFNVNGSNFVAPTEPSPQPSQSTATAPSTAPSSQPAPGGPTTEVKVEADPNNLGKYVPTPVSIHVGGTIKWTFNDVQNEPHTATSDDGSTFDSQAKVGGNKGDTFSFTFAKSGTYAYHCTFHANMRGTVTVS